MRRGWMVLLALVIGLLPAIGFLLPQPALAAEIVVMDESTDYPCSYVGLSAAIAAAMAGATEAGTVTFDCATPQINITSEIQITGSVTIDGSNAGGDPIILDGGYDGSNPASGNRIFYVDNTGNLTLHHLTLQHGASEFNLGGAIFNLGTLTIRQSTFNDNLAGTDLNPFGSGGAIFNFGTLTISQSSFTDNSAGDAGAIWNQGTAEISQSSFIDNSAIFGGAIWNGDSLTVESSTFSGNTGYSGSAIYISPSATASTLRWSTIVQPDGTGAALSIWSSVTLEGVILAGDGNNCTFSGGSTFDSFTIADDASCQLDTTVGSQVIDPGLPDTPSTIAVNGVEQTYYRLVVDSPAIDAGGSACDTDGQPDVDQIGRLRPHGIPALCDIGAVEYRAVNHPPTGNVTITSPGPVIVDEPIDVTINASGVMDQDDPDLYYWLDCESDDDPELDYSGSSTGTCTFPMPGSYTITGGVSDSQVTLTDSVTIEVYALDPVDLCANRWTGELRMPPSGRCATTETQLHIAPDAPATLCANRWTGEARYSQYGRCAATEASYLAEGLGTVDVCVNRWTGDVRIDSRCYNTERSDQL